MISINSVWKSAKRLVRPPDFVPQYGSIEFLAQDMRDLDRGMLMGLSDDALLKGHAAIGEKYEELREEATRVVDCEMTLLQESQRLHANAVQFGLVAVGVVATLGRWLDLPLVWLPFVALTLSIAAAWWYLCQEPPDYYAEIDAWHRGLPAKVGDIEIPNRLRKEMLAHQYERIYSHSLRLYRQWLHRCLAIPIILFVIGLMLLLLCVSVSGRTA
jgi:hypothetical protein